MKKIISLSLVAAALLFTGCGEKTKESATDTAAKAVESTKEAANTAVEASKEAADKAVEATKEAAKTATEAVEKAVDSAKEKVTTATVAAIDSTLAGEGQKIYAKCSGCHGVDGKTKALGKSPVIAGQSKVDLMTKMKAYKAGTRDKNGMGTLMKGQMTSLDDAAIAEVATYISTLK